MAQSLEWKQKEYLFTWRASSSTPLQEASIAWTEQSLRRAGQSSPKTEGRVIHWESRSPCDCVGTLGNDETENSRIIKKFSLLWQTINNEKSFNQWKDFTISGR